MRTIKFRGKSKLNGEWVYGDLVVVEDGMHNVVRVEIITHCFAKSFQGGGFDHYSISTLVKSETVGQFTGLLDKNGKEIYEGDIVEFVNVDFPDCVIVYDDGSFMYRELGEDISLEELKLKLTVEVIGNIHDNHELIEE